MKIILLHLSILFNFSSCRDFYLGMFKKNDLLMSQNTLYKERIPFRFTVANYGRKYKCPITYVRVLDRLNIGRGPRVEIIRGGLRKSYIVLRLTSPYNNPISVNIMVGCENKKYTRPPWKIIRPTKKSTSVDVHEATTKTVAKHDKVTDATTTTISPGNEAEPTTTDEPTATVDDETTVDEAISTVDPEATTEEPIDTTTDENTTEPGETTTVDIETPEPAAAETTPEPPT